MGYLQQQHDDYKSQLEAGYRKDEEIVKSMTPWLFRNTWGPKDRSTNRQGPVTAKTIRDEAEDPIYSALQIGAYATKTGAAYHMSQNLDWIRQKYQRNPWTGGDAPLVDVKSVTPKTKPNYNSIIKDALIDNNRFNINYNRKQFARRSSSKYWYHGNGLQLTKGGPFDPDQLDPNIYFTASGSQGELFPGGPIDPAGKEAYRVYTESLARRSGYDTFKMMKKEIFDKWPQKDQDQAFRQLWQGTQTGYVGYSEHLTAKASKKLRREKLVKRYPNETPAQIDIRLANKSKSTFDMDWFWDGEWIDEKGVRRIDGLNRGDRNAPENMQLLFNDRLKSMKDVLESIGYGSEERVGILWGDPDTNTFRDPDKRFLIKFETPQKRSVKKPYLRQNPGDAVIYRASNGKIIGNIGQYLDVLYPKKYRHPQTNEIINPELELMEKGVSNEINPRTGKLFTDVEEFRRFILTERLEIILRDTASLPSNPTARKRYIKERIDQDMVDLHDKYPWLPKPPSVVKEVETSLTTEDYDLRATSKERNIAKSKEKNTAKKSKRVNYAQILLDIFRRNK